LGKSHNKYVEAYQLIQKDHILHSVRVYSEGSWRK